MSEHFDSKIVVVVGLPSRVFSILHQFENNCFWASNRICHIFLSIWINYLFVSSLTMIRWNFYHWKISKFRDVQLFAFIACLNAILKFFTLNWSHRSMLNYGCAHNASLGKLYFLIRLNRILQFTWIHFKTFLRLDKHEILNSRWRYFFG